MNLTREEIFEAAMAMDEADRADLASILWPRGEKPMSQEWLDEIDRRTALHDADPSTAIPADVAMAAARKRLAE